MKAAARRRPEGTRKGCAPSGDVGAPTLAQPLPKRGRDGSLGPPTQSKMVGGMSDDLVGWAPSPLSWTTESTGARAMQHTPPPTPGIWNGEIKIECAGRNSLSAWKEEENQIFH